MDAFKILPSESSVNSKSKKETDRQTDINFIAEYISFAYLNVETSFLTLSGFWSMERSKFRAHLPGEWLLSGQNLQRLIRKFAFLTKAQVLID